MFPCWCCDNKGLTFVFYPANNSMFPYCCDTKGLLLYFILQLIQSLFPCWFFLLLPFHPPFGNRPSTNSCQVFAIICFPNVPRWHMDFFSCWCDTKDLTPAFYPSANSYFPCWYHDTKDLICISYPTANSRFPCWCRDTKDLASVFYLAADSSQPANPAELLQLVLLVHQHWEFSWAWRYSLCGATGSVPLWVYHMLRLR